MSEPAKYFVPGPTWVRPEILAEMTRPMIGHRSSEFKDLFGRINLGLKELFMTSQPTFVMTCSGTGVGISSTNPAPTIPSWPPGFTNRTR